jgi:hypothetical protein
MAMLSRRHKNGTKNFVVSLLEHLGCAAPAGLHKSGGT